MFFDRMKPGRCYDLRTTWGRELVKVNSVETDCVCVEVLTDGKEAVYRSAAVLGYMEMAYNLESPQVKAAEKEPEKTEEKETFVPQAAEKPAEVRPLAPRPAPAPASFTWEPGERLTGRITMFFTSNIPGVGNGYIEVNGKYTADERPERVFFHVHQVEEKALCAFLCALPRLPDFGGKPRGFRLQTPVEVTFEMADNRAHSQVNRPVAGAIRLTKEGLAALRADSATEYRFIRTGTAFVDGYRFAQGSDLLCSLTVQDDEGHAFSALLDGDNIADLRVKRFLMESRPRVPDSVALKVDLFRRWIGGRPVGPMQATHAILSGDETPWTERDEMRWNDMLTDEDREKTALVTEGKHDARSFEVRPIGGDEKKTEEEELPLEPSEFYEALPLWKDDGSETEEDKQE